MLWKNNSRVHWLKERDNNTKLFHNSLLQRRIMNWISYLRLDGGDIKDNHDEIEEELTNYFKNLLTEPNINTKEAINRITESIPPLVFP